MFLSPYLRLAIGSPDRERQDDLHLAGKNVTNGCLSHGPAGMHSKCLEGYVGIWVHGKSVTQPIYKAIQPLTKAKLAIVRDSHPTSISNMQSYAFHVAPLHSLQPV